MLSSGSFRIVDDLWITHSPREAQSAAALAQGVAPILKISDTVESPFRDTLDSLELAIDSLELVLRTLPSFLELEGHVFVALHLKHIRDDLDRFVVVVAHGDHSTFRIVRCQARGRVVWMRCG